MQYGDILQVQQEWMDLFCIWKIVCINGGMQKYLQTKASDNGCANVHFLASMEEKKYFEVWGLNVLSEYEGRYRQELNPIG